MKRVWLLRLLLLLLLLLLLPVMVLSMSNGSAQIVRHRLVVPPSILPIPLKEHFLGGEGLSNSLLVVEERVVACTMTKADG